MLNTFFKWNLLVLNFAHHFPIFANNSQSSDYGLCHNHTAEIQQVIFVQTKLLWKTVILKMIKIYLECTWIVSTATWYSCSECMILIRLPANPAYKAMPNFHLWLLMHSGLSPTTFVFCATKMVTSRPTDNDVFSRKKNYACRSVLSNLE